MTGPDGKISSGGTFIGTSFVPHAGRGWLIR